MHAVYNRMQRRRDIHAGALDSRWRMLLIRKASEFSRLHAATGKPEDRGRDLSTRAATHKGTDLDDLTYRQGVDGQESGRRSDRRHPERTARDGSAAALDHPRH